MSERIEPNRCMVGLPCLSWRGGDYRYLEHSSTAEAQGAVPQGELRASGEM